MAAYHALSAMANNPNPGSSSLSIRGAATAPSRVVANALRGAGISARTQGMDVDGGGVARGGDRPRGGVERRKRASGPLDQTGRHRPPQGAPHVDKPYGKSAPPRGTARRGGRGGLSNPGRAPSGTPPGISALRQAPSKAEKDHAKSELSRKLSSAEMKAWLENRMIAPGVLDMSNLPNDEWIKSNGIFPPGHPHAPPTAGLVFWRLIDQTFQKTDKITIHTLSLANNNFSHLKQLEKLPIWLPDIRALDLSGNPINHISELDNILASGEKKGKANAGMGSLKSLVELKLNDCLFREKTLARPDGEAIYKHEILRRFPGLRILDGVSLERVIFPIERKPKVKHTEEEKAALVAKPFSFPVEVRPEFFSEEAARNFAMAFCAKFFPCFDNNRTECLPAYAPNALISIAANTLTSRSAQQQIVLKTRLDRPNPVPFEPWINLPSRNFFRNATSIHQRMETLKTAADPARLAEWWEKAVPRTEHPLTEASKWCFECWVLDSEGGHVRLCLMIQGQFRELPSGTYRSFSRTFILVEAPEGSPAFNAGYPASILSDTMVVHSFFGTGAFDQTRPLGMNGVTIQPPSIPFTPSAASGLGGVLSPSLPSSSTAGAGANGSTGPDPTAQQSLISQISARTGMNAQYAGMCLVQNGWDLEAAIKNFDEIKASIPAEAGGAVF
ncbi:nuclear RNA export factor 1/2 [Cryptococcus neoformans Tu259-1]|uniref:mRNA export factor MEX67 n=1 Tax=Cryptococcus neoformans Tu259-1 TaxID=1230072 RepID=A0A854Q8H5_CRYNE|nr:nuclear RNA export factor 1/2 [Cryptococcus neoformans var. grubii Tu259-1]